MSNGKGSKQRPLSVSYDKYADNFDAIFRKKHIVKVKDLPNGDQYIELPKELLDKTNLKEGDVVEFTEVDNGIDKGYEIKKKK